MGMICRPEQPSHDDGRSRNPVTEFRRIVWRDRCAGGLSAAWTTAAAAATNTGQIGCALAWFCLSSVQVN